MPAFGTTAGRGEAAAVGKHKIASVTHGWLDDEPFRKANAFGDMSQMRDHLLFGNPNGLG